MDSPTIDSAREAPVAEQAYSQHTFEASEANSRLISELGLVGHREGGYFRETDRSPFTMPNPHYDPHTHAHSDRYATRNYSTLIYYLLTPTISIGRLHKNQNRIIHILQKGRGQYVLIYPDGRVKSFIVGFDHARGEISQWVVPGGVYKASFLLPLTADSQPTKDDHLLISEVVVPGFEYEDHEFLQGRARLVELVGESRAADLAFLLTD